MQESGKDRLILTKSYEISYALFRIAATLSEKDFGERLRSSGGALLEAAAVENFKQARLSLRAIECLAKFAGDIGFINLQNADSLLREVYLLDAAIIERMNAAKEDQVNLSEIFSKPFEEVIDSEMEERVKPAERRPHPPTGHQNPDRADAANGAGAGFIRGEIRQAAILEKIRQSGNCRLKDIQEILPDASERTIRYDLQSLVEQNLIERVGAGGPSVFYRMRQNGGASSEGILPDTSSRITGEV